MPGHIGTYFEIGVAMPTRSRFPRSATALLVVDAINPCDFPGGASFAKRARKTALSIARLAARAPEAGSRDFRQ